MVAPAQKLTLIPADRAEDVARAWRGSAPFVLFLLIIILNATHAPALLLLKNILALSFVFVVLRRVWQKHAVKGASSADRIEVVCDIIPSALMLSLSAIALFLLLLPWQSWQVLHVPFSLFATLVGGVLAWMVLNSRLHLVADRRFLEVSGLLHQRAMLHRPRRSWQDLHSVRLSGPAQTQAARGLGSGRQNQAAALVFDFRSGGYFSLPLHRLAPDGVDALILMLTKFADPLTLNGDVIALQKAVLTVGADTQSLSLTKFWQDSLDQSFAETNFVPLARGHQLQNGALTVLLPISSGGAAAVYLCTDRSGKQFVLKEMALPQAQEAKEPAKHLELFAREAQILARLDHPQIVRVLDNFCEHNRHYILLQFVPGITLRQYVRLHGALGEDRVRKLALQIAEILQYLHSFDEPIIHRDITPDNLVLNESTDKLTVIDFGAANALALQGSSTIIGKQCYIAPEQLRGAACIESDLFSLGATMHFLLAGEDPLPISTSHPAEIKGSVSKEMDRLVGQLTDMDVKLRPPSARRVVELLNHPQPLLTPGGH